MLVVADDLIGRAGILHRQAREILRTALSAPCSQSGFLVDCIRARMEPLGGIELQIAPRESIREPVNLDT
jgi:hypothetical protein